MRGRTLLEKLYGPGMRPPPEGSYRQDLSRCGVQDCPDPVYGTCELMVDDKPPRGDWYANLLRALPQWRYVRVAFCQAHLFEVGARSVDAADDPDSWAPGRENPYILTRPPKVNHGG